MGGIRDFKIVLLLVIVFISIISISSVSAWVFNGTVFNINGTALNNVSVNVTVRSSSGFGIIGYNSTYTNSSGWFNLTVTDNAQWFYQPVIKRGQNNLTGGTNPVQFIGQSVPAFPYAMLQSGLNSNFYLRSAGTINITAINGTPGSYITFQYIVKDQKLGYPIAMSFPSYVSSAQIEVPTNRNYSIMIFPNQSMPVSFNWNNFSSGATYNLSGANTLGIDYYNVSTQTVHKTFNTSMRLIQVNGTIFNFSTGNISGWNEFNIIPFILEPGNMIFVGRSDSGMPYNMSGFNATPYADFFGLTNGNYTISLPGPAENVTVLLFASARNGTGYYGGYRNLTVGYNSATTQANFTVYRLMSTDWASSTSNFTLKNAGASFASINISCAQQPFNIVNSSNITLSSSSASVQVKIDYRNYNATQFTFMTQTAQGSASTFYLPLLNVTGVSEMNVYLNDFAPQSLGVKTASQILSNNNITVKSFNPSAISGTNHSSSIFMKMYKSNSTCDVPNPPLACNMGSSESMDSFNPMSSMLGGGAISFRMGLSSSGIEVHYANVDMMASGPPDALFDESATNSTSGGFSEASRFGSGGPTIYDFVLVSMPYTEGSDTVTGLNESGDVNMSLGSLYDENWNLIWNSTINGTNGTALAGNYSHYSTYQTQWQTLMGSTNCTTDVSVFNSTTPCYINKTANKIWIRLPHFSGTQPSVTGSVITATAASSSSGSSGGGGGGSSASYWTLTQVVTDEQFKSGYTKSLSIKQRISLKVSNETHYVGLVGLTSNLATINVSSIIQQASLSPGDEKKFDVTNDGYYDIDVKLINIKNSQANFTVKSIYEKIPKSAEETKAKGSSESVTNPKSNNPLNETKSNNTIWIIALIVIIVAALGLIFYKYKNKKRR